MRGHNHREHKPHQARRGVHEPHGKSIERSAYQDEGKDNVEEDFHKH
ncbi:MAG: hypothetical protein UY81_C0053G0010 [Candidatus Giovannonibacteria bacterium GW2011_GWA2_53_7]|uniref:Uncharacterized protein n=1 Tax=Candidatus Giovannonibacteria bacterium GW2011_GWA2_53_7 TaxID=1618650 RepID=A0A0G2AQU3_9BACT|nr:MAG: hypothetical protein UY81_C0053G0010 [Candidatus Giovannonibacteria bacterium GW2011_GWA2_53_7]